MRLKALLFFLLVFFISAKAQNVSLTETEANQTQATEEYETKAKTLFGIASYYADKFNGRKTATGDVYSHAKFTAACNVLSLGTWIRVTNLRNNKTIIVQVNDRLHPKNKRIVDLSKIAAEKLGYIARGLTQVKVEVLAKRK